MKTILAAVAIAVASLSGLQAKGTNCPECCKDKDCAACCKGKCSECANCNK
jgi:hypothetical protein